MSEQTSLRMINLGCGSRFHPAWVNVDIAPRDPAVTACDLSKRFPFADGSFDVVYHSNVLEHIRREHAPGFLRECGRILKPRGILRVAVPDLEQICRLYLENLQRSCEQQPEAAARYDWMMLEMLDQTVREHTGGGMAEYLAQNPLPAEEFIIERIGDEGRELIHALRSQSARDAASRKRRRFRINLKSFLRRCAERLLGEDASASLKIGRFRLGGEVHQWMYDRFSLARLMTATGFVSPQLMTPRTSQIPGWPEYHLEVGADGAVHKPDSFIMECLKPA